MAVAPEGNNYTTTWGSAGFAFGACLHFGFGIPFHLGLSRLPNRTEACLIAVPFVSFIAFTLYIF